MAGFWKRLRKRALLRTPASHELSGYLECYAAGYARGLRDQRSGCAGWEDTTQKIATQLVSNRSVVEAGCWLAGRYRGYADATDDCVATERLLPLRHARCVSPIAIDLLLSHP